MTYPFSDCCPNLAGADPGCDDGWCCTHETRHDRDPMSAGYTDADVQLVAATIQARCAFCCGTSAPCPGDVVDARRILTALAEAGRLTPAGAERKAALQDFATLRAKFESLPYWDDGAFAILDRLDQWLGVGADEDGTT